ncbi:hypothetical protein PbB2_01896 [Candidatus Phycosocius bacilliformis]|uniref:Uncharacterized protein n=1 Tax=Candidatus Phycosocius bacilliformis TaxID=1445552 RepID=A0A2P2EAY7_9PROT|nr:hypothetical protein [Candidatus Phycosocius bacilliformis]GBF58224.1 hypothetical protein PbB2_01896 [Candidatus Phycosocius bacilliformis]
MLSADTATDADCRLLDWAVQTGATNRAGARTRNMTFSCPPQETGMGDVIEHEGGAAPV